MINFPIIVAYNMKDKKVGCALIQAALGSTLSGADLGLYFDAILWELDPLKCELFTVNSQVEFDFMVRITREANIK